MSITPPCIWSWCYLLTSLALALTSRQTTVAGDVAVWQRWEQRLTATNSTADLCHALSLRARFRGPDGVTFESDGFWDGDHAFVVRTMFPTPGIWSWSTISTPPDPGLTQEVRLSCSQPAVVTPWPQRVA